MRERVPSLAFAVGGIALGLGAGFVISQSRLLGVLMVAGCLLLLLIGTVPVSVALIALVGSFAAQRLGAGVLPSATGVSYADALLALGAALAVPTLLNGPEARRLKPVLIGLAVYLAALLPAVIADDSTRGIFEWAHRLVLVGGAVAVGAWITREGKVRLALWLLLGVATVLALASMLIAIRTGFEPVYPLGLHKNFAGAQLSMVLILVVCARRWFGFALPVQLLFSVVLIGGLLATQSRGSMLAAAAGIVFVFALVPRTGQRQQSRVLVGIAVIVLVGFAYYSVRADFNEDAVDFDNNSIGQRQKVEERAQEIWRTSPITGVGLKYFNSGEWGPLGQPPNIVVNNELAESGLVGLVGFLALQGAAIGAAVRRRRDSGLVLVGGACAFAVLVHGMVDIYWIAGSVSLPFILLGLGLATEPLERAPEVAGSRRARRAPRLDGSPRTASERRPEPVVAGKRRAT